MPPLTSGELENPQPCGLMFSSVSFALASAVMSRDITADAKAKLTDENIKPQGWGFSSSPLVSGGIVAVFAGGGKDGKGVLAYDALTGEPRWSDRKGVG